jgi:hypothetical protein
VLAQLGIFFKDIIFTIPILEPPPVVESDPFSQPFGIRNGMNFFTMHDTCAIGFIESQVYDSSSGYVDAIIPRKLNYIGPGKPNYFEMTPGLRVSVGKPVYAAFRFVVTYYINTLGIHWSKTSDIGSCQWKLETKGMWECTESSNAHKVPLLKFDPASGNVILRNELVVDDPEQKKKIIEQCNQ